METDQELAETGPYHNPPVQNQFHLQLLSQDQNQVQSSKVK